MTIVKIEKAIDEFAEISKIFLEEECKEPVLKYHRVEDYEKLIDLSLKKEGCSEAVFFNLLKDISLLTPRTSSKSFFNQLFAGRSAPCLSAELLTVVLNTTMHTYKVAGIQVLIEKKIVGELLKRVGYTQGEGLMNPGGSLSNMVSMMIARNEKDETILNEGLRRGKFIAYTSTESHYSVRKNAGILGIGKNNVRTIKSDYLGRMDLDDLMAEIKKDLLEGNHPFYINATAGTTVLGAFDPIDEISKVAKKYNLWLHTDGALGGSALLSQQHKHLLKGSELSDSFTWNAHKMMNVPLTASFLLIQKKGLLKKHLSEEADYLFQEEKEELDLGNMSIQCGRKVDALKVWAAFKYYGISGMENRINHLFSLAKYAALCVEQDPLFKLFRRPESVNVCFTINGVDPVMICQYLHKKGLLMVGYSKAKGTTFIRMACLNAALNTKDIDDFFSHVKYAAKEISKG